MRDFLVHVSRFASKHHFFIFILLCLVSELKMIANNNSEKDEFRNSCVGHFMSNELKKWEKSTHHLRFPSNLIGR